MAVKPIMSSKHQAQAKVITPLGGVQELVKARPSILCRPLIRNDDISLMAVCCYTGTRAHMFKRASLVFTLVKDKMSCFDFKTLSRVNLQ